MKGSGFFLLLKYAIKEFLDDRDFNNLSPRTINAYSMNLEKFHGYCVTKEVVDLSDITSSLFKEYLLYCKNELKNNPTTLNTKLRQLRTFFNYLANNEVINSKSIPTAKIPYVKEEIKIEVFSDDQIRQMLNYYRRVWVILTHLFSKSTSFQRSPKISPCRIPVVRVKTKAI